ncbi:hypothetical protein I4641_02435 [Waterburya agarophytonicola K14]|uniref:Uncharacterized protein n=1 Tax=Waterburya agarophytonicola KI4 TaxID=2874699 RepID=A0A964BMD3_9CYAN|nr:hypothetical protein [Waterburya agarophytonicola]MCC0175839.1 hypothetical protein [Waterburya agarophytonicola KI4]
MPKKKIEPNVQNQIDPGVLYIRYDKNTFCGQVIEKLKQDPNYKLNKRILDLIFLAEIVEVFNLNDVDSSILSHVYYRSLKLFSDKLNQAKFKINSLSEQIAREKDVKANSSLILIGGQLSDMACQSTESLTHKE